MQSLNLVDKLVNGDLKGYQEVWEEMVLLKSMEDGSAGHPTKSSQSSSQLTSEMIESDHQVKKPRSFKESKKYAQTREAALASNKPSKTDVKSTQPQTQPQTQTHPSPKLQKLMELQKKAKGKATKSNTKTTEEQQEATSKSKKMLRSWGENGVALSGDDSKKLDFSNDKEGDENQDDIDGIDHDTLIDKTALGTVSAEGLYTPSEILSTTSLNKLNQDTPSNQQPSRPSSFFNYLKSLAPSSSSVITSDVLAPTLSNLKTHLISKNVASDVTDSILKNLETSLLGTKKTLFSSLDSILSQALEPILSQILSPSTSTDILRDILARKDLNTQKRNAHPNQPTDPNTSTHDPYTLVFVGVNGVGKSTQLSKIAFWLLGNGIRVLVAACDTFRAGAVEQLRVHVRNLRALEESMGGAGGRFGASGKNKSGVCIELFEKGYGKDAAGIAKDAILYGKQNNFDVVLIDTAGRMQDNEPLMRSLAKLVSINNPDKILFVGEALVGNESISQLTKFNQALSDFSGKTQEHTRVVDGIILSKFDTVDDKVGAALSMTFVTGKPVLFVGTGQTYTDLKRLNVRNVVETLLG